MARLENQKLKILYIKDYLEQFSSPDTPVSAAALMAHLEAHEISCERKSIYHDIASLQSYGMDIQMKHGPDGGYYLASRTFTLPELKLLVDAAQSSRFLTEEKSRNLVGKLCQLCNQNEERLILRQVAVAGRVKSMNDSIFDNVDAIQEAMGENHKISFRYFDWDLKHDPKFRGKTYTASPYALLWETDNYYLIAFTPEHGVTHYRVDRMAEIRTLPEPRDRCPDLENRNLTGYSKKVFQMFRGETVTVKMRFHRSLINVVFDRFGPDCLLIPDGQDYFTFTAPVEISPLFLSWVMGFGSKAKILHPKYVVDRFLSLATEAATQYE